MESVAVDDSHIAKDLAKLTVDTIICTGNFVGHVKIKYIDEVFNNIFLRFFRNIASDLFNLV